MHVRPYKAINEDALFVQQTDAASRRATCKARSLARFDSLEEIKEMILGVLAFPCCSSRRNCSLITASTKNFLSCMSLCKTFLSRICSRPLVQSPSCFDSSHPLRMYWTVRFMSSLMRRSSCGVYQHFAISISGFSCRQGPLWMTMVSAKVTWRRVKGFVRSWLAVRRGVMLDDDGCWLSICKNTNRVGGVVEKQR